MSALLLNETQMVRNCSRCGIRPGTRQMCLDYGRKFDWDDWCNQCVQDQEEILMRRYRKRKLKSKILPPIIDRDPGDETENK
jgi:hypothetical protein